MGLSVGGGGHQGGGAGIPGGHDPWGDMMLGGDMDDGEMRFSREQETEVILAFTLLVTILLTFLGYVLLSDPQTPPFKMFEFIFLLVIFMLLNFYDVCKATFNLKWATKVSFLTQYLLLGS